MTEREAKDAATLLREEGFDAEAACSPLGTIGWEVRLADVRGGKLYAFSHAALRFMLAAGLVAKLKGGASC